MAVGTVTRPDSSEVFQYDFEDFPAYVHTGIMSAWLGLKTASHWHEDLEFILVERGEMTYYVNGQAVPLKPGQLLLVNSHTLHNQSSDDPDCIYLCTLLHPMLLCASRMVEETYVAPAAGGVPYLLLDGSEDWQARVIEDIRKIHASMSSDCAPLHIQSLFYDIWAQLHEHVFKDQPKKSGSNPGDKSLTAMKNMILYVQHHYKEKVSLEEIAQAGAVCKTTCLNLFRKYLRDTPVNYLIHYRLKHAADLLTSTDLSVTDVAFETGFSNISYFIETFRKVYGKSPLEHRKESARRK